ncbi:uncharacterized protein LOC110456075 [Mizuhopecten yessoensis]|uniref:Uncharacterized protein n=1 Tax=Mizuhopecten yessoensis TaxID=6573 RepID=A0A210QBP5_MIZYE|nr:uncharacterized protein LOC110456075 [Mizuhopecten yessoensis]OWF46149.1 hypothetical protein KP79_PYT14850 [Mizuhopecten yessoensis]
MDEVRLEFSAKAEKKQRLVGAFEEKHAAALGGINVSQKLRGKLQLLADDVWDARDDLTKNQISYCEMVDRESNLKDGMLQISGHIQQYIHTFLVRRIAACIGNANKFLQSTYKFQEAHVFNKRHLSVIHTVIHTISAMRKGDVADELIAQASKIYTFPNTKDYPVYMKGTPKLPEVKLNERIGSSCVHTHSKTVVGSLRLSENLNGYRLKISGRADAAPPNPGFFHLKTDHHVKCKLGMFDGDVGFCWTRKTNYSREKTWGFFMRPPALTDFTEHTPKDSSLQDTIPTALVNLKILKIPEINI